jgi:hypothetical protein
VQEELKTEKVELQGALQRVSELEGTVSALRDSCAGLRRDLDDEREGRSHEVAEWSVRLLSST